MDARQLRGLQIAATARLEEKLQGLWFVPSQTGSGKYIVRPDGAKPFCSCPDHEERHVKCKHHWAVEYVIQRELNLDGTATVTETLRVTEAVEVETTERKTYKQDWPNYNAAQVNERRHFLDLLAELCRTIPEPERSKSLRGRKPIPLRDALFAAVLKVYSMMSARRFSGELQEAFDAGYLSRLPHFNSVLDVFDRPEVTDIRKGMIETAAKPLREVETTFAVDSSGFATSRFTRWFDEKYGGIRSKADWVKAHIAVGTQTNVITAVQILEQRSGDSPQVPELVETTARTFCISEVSADKAYAGNPNFEAVEKHGGTFYPTFKCKLPLWHRKLPLRQCRMQFN